MPTIPGYEAQRNIDAKPFAAFRDEATVDFESNQKVFGALQEVTKQWSDAHDKMQETEAKANFSIKSIDIYSRALQDPDYKNSNKYLQEIADARMESVSSIDNKQVAGLLGNEFAYDEAVMKFKIDSDFRKKQIDYTRAVTLPGTLNKYASDMIVAESENEYLNSKFKMFEEIDENVKAMVLSQEEGAKMKSSTLYNAAESAVYSNPERGMELINNGRFDLSSEQSTKLKQEAVNIIKKRDELAKFEFEKREMAEVINMSKMVMEGTLTPDVPRKLEQAGIVSVETATTFYNAATGVKSTIPSSTSTDEANYLLDLLERSEGDKESINKTLRSAASLYTQGKLGANQFRYFIDGAVEKADRYSKGQLGKSDVQVARENAWSTITAYYNYVAGQLSKKEQKNDMGEALGKFTDRVGNGADPQEAANQVIKEDVYKKAPYLNSAEDGQRFVDPVTGAVAIKDSKAPMGYRME
jgi:hypothetical protein